MMDEGAVPRREVRWERMFPDELEAAFAACPLVYFSYGLCEPHGPQNAVGLDTLKAHAIACGAARIGGGIVTPPHYWHVHELASAAAWAQEAIGEIERPWLTSIPPWLYLKTILYHLRTADVHGFHAAILITGHSATDPEDLETLVELVQPHVGTRLFGVLQSTGLSEELDHAGRTETSLLWATDPDCVDVSRLPDASAPGPHWAMGADASEASRRAGERMVAEEARWLADRGHELLAAFERRRPRHTLRTFGDVERLWAEVVRPALPRFRSMQETWWEDAPPPVSEESVWWPNSRFPPGAELL